MNKAFSENPQANSKKSLKGEAQVDRIYAHVFDAIVDHRLQPGTHLKEDELCELFGIGRTRLRKVLSRLAADHVVELVVNRGAFVARPSVDEAREVFRARRLIEGDLTRRAAERRDTGMKAALEQHMHCEHEAREAGDTSRVIRRCGRYHQVLADQADSPIMARFVRELIARSSLIIAVYEAKAPSECEIDEHRLLSDLVVSGKADEAVELMNTHLQGIEDRLLLKASHKEQNGLISSLGSFSP
ncbi:GntR family transcriptional regulator [Sulfitobacter sp. SK011]|uniref:GntR family transcriptional regulator n=1 Tax=Sulfitobacter sp. SK011 TaxID=1389004 RepID=UPI0013B44531|nr:GntR family transcriptional regulator [Sulfitobacter sp. SK011]